MTHHEQFCEWSGLGRVTATAIAECEMVPFHVDGELAALGALHGTEIHFAAAPKFRGSLITRRRAAEYLGALLERKSFLTTRVIQGEPTRFVERMGFVETGSDGIFRSYMLCAVPFARAALEN